MVRRLLARLNREWRWARMWDIELRSLDKDDS
jgi:hypothetical protein